MRLENKRMDISKNRIPSGVGLWVAAAVLMASLSVAGCADAQSYPGYGYEADQYAPAAPPYVAGGGWYEGGRDWPRAETRERTWRRHEAERERRRREQYGQFDEQRWQQEVLREQQAHNQRLLLQQQAYGQARLLQEQRQAQQQAGVRAQQ